MSVHYKFKAAIDYSTLPVDGMHISVEDLIEAIMEQKKLSRNYPFELVISDAETHKGKQYWELFSPFFLFDIYYIVDSPALFSLKFLFQVLKWNVYDKSHMCFFFFYSVYGPERAHPQEHFSVGGEEAHG